MNFIKNLNFEIVLESYLNLGNILFLAGIFFLPSALPIGGFLLLISIFISFHTNKENFLKNRWNFILFISIILIVISTFYSSIINPSEELLDFNKSIIWLNLFNWVPIYFAYIGFQAYLKSQKQKLLFQKVLIAGTVPVIASCIMQRFFNMYGPFETLFGTIVWFNYDFSLEKVQHATGLFNNPNYLGMWLTICLPFSLSALKLEKNNSLNLIFLYLLNILIIYFAFATYSRNALIGLFISFLLVLNRKKFIYFSIFFLISVFIFSYLLPNMINFSSTNFIDLHQANTFQKFSSLNFSLKNPRIAIWSNALNFITMRPILGWGPSSFPYVFYENAYLEIPLNKYQHTHNLVFELAYNFGIPIALLITSTIFAMFIKVFKKIKKVAKKSYTYLMYKPLLASFFIFLIAHLTDITYYDGKISILFALLLASLKNILDENIELKNISKIYIE